MLYFDNVVTLEKVQELNEFVNNKNRVVEVIKPTEVAPQYQYRSKIASNICHTLKTRFNKDMKIGSRLKEKELLDICHELNDQSKT